MSTFSKRHLGITEAYIEGYVATGKIGFWQLRIAIFHDYTGIQKTLKYMTVIYLGSDAVVRSSQNPIFPVATYKLP